MHGFNSIEHKQIGPNQAELTLMGILEDYEKMTRDRDVKVSKDMINSLYNADRLLSRRSDYWRRVIPDNLVSEKLKEEQDEEEQDEEEQDEEEQDEECWGACRAEEFFFRYQAREGLQ